MDQGGGAGIGCLCVGQSCISSVPRLTDSTWFGDLSMAGLAMSHARALGLDKIRNPRKTPEDWREWIYLSLMDKM